MEEGSQSGGTADDSSVTDMSLRRCTQQLGSRLLQLHQAYGATSSALPVAVSHLGEVADRPYTPLWRGEGQIYHCFTSAGAGHLLGMLGAQQLFCHAGFASDTVTTSEGTLVARDAGLPPTTYAVKNPSADIT